MDPKLVVSANREYPLILSFEEILYVYAKLGDHYNWLPSIGLIDACDLYIHTTRTSYVQSKTPYRKANDEFKLKS